LTGGIATGKSTVRQRFEELGVPTIDSDVLAREVVARGTPGLAAVADHFGRGILTPDGSLDRQALARIVFADADARKALEAIVHPEIQRRTADWFTSLDTALHSYAIADIPLLYEIGRDRDFDAVIVAACDPATQLRRLMSRDALSEADAAQRIVAQLPIAEKAGRADYVVRTDGSLADTWQQVEALHRRLVDLQ
jgi:dephospho-CoA kinase